MATAARAENPEPAGPLLDIDAEGLVALDDVAVDALVEAEKAQQRRRRAAVLFITEAAKLTVMLALAGFVETSLASEMQAFLVLLQHCERDMLRCFTDGTFVPSFSFYARAVLGPSSRLTTLFELEQEPQVLSSSGRAASRG